MTIRTLIRREQSTCNATTCGTCAQKIVGDTKAWCLLFNAELRPRGKRVVSYPRLQECHHAEDRGLGLRDD